MADLRSKLMPLVIEAAKKYGIPIEVFDWLLLQESGYTSDVVYGDRESSAGAQGIGQFMPDTAKSAMERWGYKFDPLDPNEAIDASARYLKESIDYYGDIEKGLAAYNAGSGRVDRAIKAGGDAWDEYLPDETKSYLASYRSNAGYQSSGEPWQVGSQVESQKTAAMPMAAGGIDEDEWAILDRWQNYKKKKKVSPAVDRLNKQIDEYKAANASKVVDEVSATKFLKDLSKMTNARNALEATEGSTSALESMMEGIISDYIEKGVPATEAAAESERLLKQFGLDTGAVTGPYQLKRERAADDAGIIADNWLAERMKAQDEVALWNDKTAAYGKAADQAQAMFDKIFPFMVSKAGPHELNSMKAGGAMNQLFNRLGMEYTPPEPIGTTEINPVDYANQALIAAGPPPSAVGAPPKIPTMTEALGPVPELPTPPRLPKAPTMAELFNRMMGLLEKEQSYESYEGGGPATPTSPVVGPGQFYGPPVPPGFGLTYPGAKSTSSNPFDFLPEIDVNLGIPTSPSLIPTQSLVRGLGTTGTYRGIEIPGLTELLKRLSRRRTTGTGVGSYRNLGGY